MLKATMDIIDDALRTKQGTLPYDPKTAHLVKLLTRFLTTYDMDIFTWVDTVRVHQEQELLRNKTMVGRMFYSTVSLIRAWLLSPHHNSAAAAVRVEEIMTLYALMEDIVPDPNVSVRVLGQVSIPEIGRAHV